ncbi:hypothetical protein GCM10010341_87330 [Streptomyces noursei]|nr:hypothetical protein GCM10010341_87330 [Streptomyces noursei]
MLGGEGGERVGQQGAHRASDTADAEGAQHLAPEVGQVRLRGGKLSDQSIGVAGQDATGVGQADAAAVRLEEGVTRFAFQFGQLLGDRGGRHVQGAGGPGDRSVGGDGGERAEPINAEHIKDATDYWA